MPDIAMCSNHACPMNSKCYRYQAEPSMMQNYTLFTPTTDKSCEHFMVIYDKALSDE